MALEKNIGAFICLDLPGSKVVVGDGPALAALKAAYPEAHFLGARFGEDLAAFLNVPIEVCAVLDIASGQEAEALRLRGVVEPVQVGAGVGTHQVEVSLRHVDQTGVVPAE